MCENGESPGREEEKMRLTCSTAQFPLICLRIRSGGMFCVSFVLFTKMKKFDVKLDSKTFWLIRVFGLELSFVK